MARREPTGFEIAVVGLAGRFPGANDPQELWRNLEAGVESIRFFDADELRAAGADEAMIADPNHVPAKPELVDVDRFDAAFFGINPREAEVLDPQQRLFLETAVQALIDAGHGGDVGPAGGGTAGKGRPSIGVYGGTGMSQYLLRNLATRPEVLAAVGELPVVLGNDKDYLATRLAYELDLEGPAVSVQTACSTSLVAVHLACQALNDGECDLALAGGVSLALNPVPGYPYSKDGILSPDGHCRTFDQDAQGTIFGSGVGVVALRRLSDAMADGDRIRGVVLGSAINNDGGAKVGFTAPRVEGQARVIRAALDSAEVDPASISYVEAHGTATPLGDPIEISALRRAHGDPAATGETGVCRIGSIKSNLGHLDTAAGVAGLIKTVLALEHRRIPKSLHFQAPNPEIDFAASRFRVAAETLDWEFHGQPRRAAVSSFGIGGTNAHVVLEEAPPRSPSGPSRPRQLLVLSAASESALEASSDALAEQLESDSLAPPPPSPLPPRGERGAEAVDPLADVAYTLAVGRPRRAFSRVLVAGGSAEAARALRERDPEALSDHFEDSPQRAPIFLFPGQGSQWLGMGRELDAAEPVFRRQLDRCGEILGDTLGLDLRRLLWGEGDRGDANLEEATSRLRRTRFAQPALFAVEYALARTWMAWGVCPEALVGHSLGEWVAATVAGVFRLEEALPLVAERGSRMDACPTGSMLSVTLGEAELLERLPRGLSLAAVNGPRMTVASGPDASIDTLASALSAEGIENRRLHTSHAFHSASMNPVVGVFEQAVARLSLSPPEIPILANGSGTWMTDAEATDPGYWARQLRRPVRFGDALSELFRDPDRVLLEVGPGRALSSLATSHPDRPRSLAVVASGRPAAAGEGEHEALYRAAGRLWLLGAGLDPRQLFEGEKRRRVELPAYPFDRTRFWIDPAGSPTPEISTVSTPAADSTTPDGAEAGDSAPASVGEAHARPVLGRAFVAPRTETEEAVAAIWRESLGLSEIGVHDDFLDLGGHSLLATRVAARIEEQLAVETSVRDLFEQPTVAGLAGRIEERRAAGSQSVPASERWPRIEPDLDRAAEPFPATEVQQAYWIGRGTAFELGNVATHMYTELEGVGLDLGRLESAWRRLVDRHGMLRAEFLPDGRQRILARVPPYRFQTLDLRSASPDDAAAGAAAVRKEMSHQVLSAESWPLFEIRATRLPATEGDERERLRLHVSFDFLIGDAWSIELLTGEWLQLYQAPESTLEPLSLSFRDYVLAEDGLRESAAYERDLEYWRRRLDGLPGGPQLPLRQDPESLEAPTFVRRSGRLDVDLWSRLQARATAAKLTPSALLLAAFSEALGRFAKSRHFLLTLTLFRRLPLHPEVDQIVGDFTSLTLLEVEGGGDTFTDRARAIQQRLIDDLDHRLVSGVRVLREAASRRGGEQLQAPVVFTSLLGLGGGDEEEDAAAAAARLGAELELEQVYSVSQTPQVWIDHQVSEADGELVWSWDAVDELFPDGLLDALFDTYLRLLVTLAGEAEEVEDAKESTAVAGLATDPLALPAEQLALRVLPEPVEPPPQVLLHQLFEQRALSQPEAPAVFDGERVVSYGALLRLAHDLGAELVDRGARRNALVAVVMEKGWEQALAVLAIHFAGAAYLPIDPALPAARIAHLLRRGEAQLLLTQERLDLEWPEGVEVRALGAAELEAATDPGVADLGPSKPLQEPGDLAYVIFTSGSTGEPKGVMIDHRGAANTVLDVNRRFDVGPDDRVLALSGLGFDLSVYDLFGIFAAGGAVVLPEPGSERRPDRWLELLDRHRVTLWNTVPALMTMLVETLEGMGGGSEARLPEGLRLVMMSGDWIPVTLPGRLRRLAPGEVEIVSLGGATEASIWSILYPIGEVDPEWPSIPYGRAMDHQSFHVLDDALDPRPDHVPGDLYIGGVGVALGYWRDPERTAASFVEHPKTGERLYRTGDLGRWRGDGTIEFLGREDFQVKVQGHRIELGEIEAALLDHPQVTAAVALAVGERDRRRLVAMLQGVGGAPSSGDASNELIRRHLEARLPAYMVPPRFVWLDALPLTANGKIDRKALEGLATEAGVSASASGSVTSVAAAAADSSANPVLDQLAELWRQVLGVEAVAPGDNFFALGGDSILAIQVVSRANQAGLVLTPDQVFVHPTLAELAASVEPSTVAPVAEGTLGEVDSAPVVGPVPLTPIQHWFFEHDFTRPAHWNQATVLGLGRRIEGRDLRRAVAALAEHHDALRLRFAVTGAGVKQWNAPPGEPPPVVEIDLGSLAGLAEGTLDTVVLDSVARRAATALQGSLDLRRGPLFRVALLRVPEGDDQLLLIFHHLVVDGVSWRVLLEDLERALSLDRGREIVLPVKTVAFKTWAEALEADAWEGRHRGDLGRWTPPTGLPVLALPTDFSAPAEANTEASVETVELAVGAELTDRLLRFAPGHHRARIQEVLLAALTLALGRLVASTSDESTGQSTGGALAIDLETHGRDAVGDRLDLSRTVGWLTAVHPLWAELPGGDTAADPVAVLRQTKATLRRLEGHGPGFGVLRYLDPDPEVQEALATTSAAVSFNYLGRFDQVTAPESLFTGGRFETGPWNAPELRRRHALFVFGSIAGSGDSAADQDGGVELSLGFAFSRALHRRGTIEALAADVRGALEALLDASAQPALVGADFPLAQLDEDSLVGALRAWLTVSKTEPLRTQPVPSPPGPLLGAAQARGRERGDRNLRSPGGAQQHSPGHRPGSGSGPVTVADLYPLAPLQEGLLFHGLYAADAAGEASDDLYVTTFACTLDGLDPAAFEAAWGDALERHPVLRTAFLWHGVERPHQVVLDGISLPFRHEDWSRLEETERERRLGEVMAEEAARVGDPSRAPLLAAALVRLDAERYRFVFAHHHLILDGWSLPLLLGDVFALYAARLGGRPADPPPAPYRDYLAWLAEQDAAAALDHWHGVLAGFDTPTALAFDRGRVGTPATVADHASRRLGPERLDRLDQALRPYGLTRGTVVQGVWALLLAHHGDEDDVVYGLSVAGRPADLAGVEGMLGVFTNTLPMRARRLGDAIAHRWLAELQDQQVALRRFEHSPLAEAQKASDVPAGLPLFESLVVFENYPAPTGDGDEGLQPYDVDARLETHYPLLASANPGPDGLALDLAFDPTRYARPDVERLMSTWVRLLDALAQDPTRPLADLPWLDPVERQQMLVEWADGGAVRRLASSPDDSCEQGDLATQILDLARRHPERPALVTADGTVTSYGALAETVEALRDRLRAVGVGGEDLVAVHLRRSPGAIVALLSTLAAGAGYLPLDPELPDERLDFLLDDAAPRCVLTEQGDPLAERLDGRLPVLTLDPATGVVIDVGEPASGDAQKEIYLGPDSAAYLIYTSGSTGRPKAVVVPRRALAAYVRSAIHAYQLAADDRVMLFASLSFDASVEEIFPTLVRGATLVLRADGLPGAAGEFLADVDRLGVSVLGLPTAYFHELARGWVDDGLATPAALRQVIVGGEALRVDPTAAWRRHVPGVRLANTYGPTEATVVATRYDIALGDDGELPTPIAIGRPIEGVRAHVFDRHLRPVPVHGVGELCLSGVGLARGYLGRPATTAEAFVPSPEGDGERLYRTGDLARFRPGGNLEIAGRRDRQVKVRGFRVELGELEVALERHPAVAAASVVAVAGTGGPQPSSAHLRLAAFVEPNPGAEVPESAKLRAFLAESLPAALLPASFEILDPLPRTVSGKIDRRALPTPGAAVDGRITDSRAPRNERERLVAETWGAILGHDTVAVDDDFFQLGGDSILSIQVVSRLLRAGLRVTPQQIFEQRTVEALARVATTAGASTAPQGPVTGESPLLPIQRRFLDRRPEDPHHFNQALLLATREPFEPGVLATALDALARHHDALRLRFTEGSGGEDTDGEDTRAGWRAEHAPASSGGHWPLTVVDLATVEGAVGPALERAAAQAQRAFDLAQGPLARGVLFRGGKALGHDRLLLVVHHLVVDGVSWRILLEDLELGLRQLANTAGDQAARLDLPPKTTPFAHWAERVAEANRGGEAERSREALRTRLASTRPLLASGEPVDAGRVAEAETLTLEIDRETTEALLREVPEVYGTRIDDALLAALALAMGKVEGAAGPVRVDLERHGRSLGTDEATSEGASPAATDLDLTRTVGWFTRILPLVLDVGADPGTTLKGTKERLRGLAALGDEFDPDATDASEPLAPADLLFNYLGQLDTSLPEDSLFTAAAESTGLPASPRQQREHPIEVNAAVSEGRLGLAWTFAGNGARRLVTALVEAYPRAVAELVEHCRNPDAGGYTPSDFPLMDFDQSELDDLASDLASDLAGDLAGAFEEDGP